MPSDPMGFPPKLQILNKYRTIPSFSEVKLIQLRGALETVINFYILYCSATPPSVTILNRISSFFKFMSSSTQALMTSVPIEKPTRVICLSEKCSTSWWANYFPDSPALVWADQKLLFPSFPFLMKVRAALKTPLPKHLASENGPLMIASSTTHPTIIPRDARRL